MKKYKNSFDYISNELSLEELESAIYGFENWLKTHDFHEPGIFREKCFSYACTILEKNVLITDDLITQFGYQLYRVYSLYILSK